MKTTLVLGSTGKIGHLLTKKLIDKKYRVVALVRNPNKLTTQSSNLKIIQGDVASKSDLENALMGVDVVVSVLGHGFRTSYPIQKRTMESLMPVMHKMNIKRLIAITGSDLFIKGDSDPLYARLQRRLFSFVDPYRMNDAIDQQGIIEKSNLDWTVIRTPVHSNGETVAVKVINKKPFLWQKISREVVVEFIIECIEKKSFIRQSPIII